MQIWVDVAKYAKVQVELAQKEINANAPWIEVVKKQKGTLVDKMQMINATLKEAMRITWMSGWAKKGIPQEDAKNLRNKGWGNRIFHLL